MIPAGPGDGSRPAGPGSVPGGDVLTLAAAVSRRLAVAGFTGQAEALARLVRDAVGPDSTDVVGAAGGATPGAPPAGRVRPPVVAHLPAALLVAEEGEVTDLLRGVAPAAAWTRTASYLQAPPSPRFPDRYAHATLLGPPDGGPVAADGRGAASEVGPEAALGLLLLAPATHYPPHRHPADEVYLPLAPADWLEAGGGYAAVAAGTLRHHRPWQPHAVRTGAGPLLAVYVWTGDVRTPSQLCPPPSDHPS